MTRTKLIASVVLLLSGPLGASAQTTQLVLDSQPGDYIGGGIKQTFTLADGNFRAVRNFDRGVSVAFTEPDYTPWWYLDFAAPGGAPLAPGVYEGAVRFPFQGPLQPGLSVSGDGRGCNTLTGRFEVHEVAYGPAGDVLSFAADFEQHCEGAAPALFGSIHFNSGAPVPPALTLSLRGCTSCRAGDYFAVEGRLTNPDTRDVVVEIKVGMRLPNGSALNLLGQAGEHLVLTLPAGFDQTFPIINLRLPPGLQTGAWRFEGTLLEVVLGRTFDRKVKVFEIEP